METQSVIVYRNRSEQAMDEFMYNGDGVLYILGAVFFIVVYAILESVVPQSRPKSISGEYRSYTLMAIALAITVGFVKYVL